MSLDDYKLSAELFGHSLDVRSVAAADDYIVSGSRDKTAKIWQNSGFGYSERLTLLNHKNFVSCVCVMNNGEFICTGSNDTTVCVYAAGSSEPFTVLKGHSGTVSALASGIESGVLVSGSWDKTALIWKIAGFGESPSIKLEGHEAAVWAVCAMQSGKFVTGSADKTIIYWNNSGQKLKVLKGHKDCVRALLSLPNDCLISGSNDAVIMFWNEDGECVKELSGHTNYIYSMAFNFAVGPDVFVSCGEDSTVRMWNSEGELGNAITLPAESVWSVTCLKNGDIVTGTSDGVVRIFTKDPSRVADEQALATFNAAVEVRVREASLALGGVKVNELPGPEALLQKGKSEDQTKMIRHPDGKIICYQWSNGKWNSIGDVIGAAGGTQQTSGKNLYEGKEYDYVFNVDIADDKPPLKLPYNRGEDPWMAAQKFIHRNELPQVYLDQVANFIMKNSANAPIIEAASSSSYADPFTGGGRYIPGSGQDFNTGGGNVDPFTGGASYSTQSVPSVPVNFIPRSGQNLDPFTGASSHHTSSAAASSSVKHFPVHDYVTIVTCDPAKVLTKLREFNDTVDESLRATESELEQAIKLAANDFSSNLSVGTLKKLLLWPKEKLFPVLDVVRLAVCDANTCVQLISDDILQLVIQNIDVPPANQLMSLRILSNMLMHGHGRTLIKGGLDNALAAIGNTKKGSPNLQIALATFLLNLTIVQLENADEMQCQFLTKSITDFLLWSTDAEALYRCYRAIGNLLSTAHGPTISAQLVCNDQAIDALRNNMSATQQSGFEKINEVARDVVNSL